MSPADDDDAPATRLRIDDKIAAEASEVAAAQEACAEAAYDLADAWDAIGNAHRDRQPAETIDDAPARAAAPYREAVAALRHRRAELAILETERRKILRRTRRRPEPR